MGLLIVLLGQLGQLLILARMLPLLLELAMHLAILMMTLNMKGILDRVLLALDQPDLKLQQRKRLIRLVGIRVSSDKLILEHFNTDDTTLKLSTPSREAGIRSDQLDIGLIVLLSNKAQKPISFTYRITVI